MAYTEKGTVEDFIIRELRRLGWAYIKPEDMRGKRVDFEQPLVGEDLKSAVKRINSEVELSDADLDFIIVSLRTIPTTVDGIKRFLDIFRNGLLVPVQKENKERVIKLLDLENVENNEFVVTNQFTVEGLRGSLGTREDVILLVNGIPLALVECKSPVREEISWLDGYKQIKRYEEEVPQLFKYVQFSITTDGTKTYYFPNAFNEEEKDSLGVWKDPYPHRKDRFREDNLKIAIYGLLSRQNFLDLIENYIFVRKEKDRSTKVMSRYMQFRASTRIFNRVTNTLKGKGEGKFGLIWHWQGSGKTYTMAFSAWKLLHCPEAENPSIFVMVDRKNLEEQIEKDFGFLGIPIEKVPSIRKLIEILRWGKEGKRGIFLVTLEKFSPQQFAQLDKEGERLEIERENVIVLADEVHRTHYRKFATIMRSVFKNAFIFGFTGTPLSKIQRNTFQKFCPREELYLDRYSMLDAQRDGFTVPLSYQAKLSKYHLNEEQLKSLTRFEEEEIETLSAEERKELRKKVSVIRTFAKKPDRIENITRSLSEHFKNVVEPTELKAMVVTIDRETCILYKNAIDKFLPSNYSEVVMTFDPNKRIIRDYFKTLEERYGTKSVKQIHKKIIDGFKTRKTPKILIVTDMLITGFDAPNLWTMYLDKPLKEHRTLQTIARTNRPCGSKKFGLIIDYIGILKELEKAFEKFESGDARSLRAVIRGLDKEEQEFKKLLEKGLRFFEGVKREDTRESLENVLERLVDPEKAKEFEEIMRGLMKSYEMLSGEPFLRDYLSDYKWLVQVYVAYNKKYKKADVDELKIDLLSRKTLKLIRQTIDVKKIEDRYPTVTVDDKYLERLKRAIPKTRGAAIDIGANIRRESEAHPNSPFFISLGKQVKATYEGLRTKKIETEKAIQRFLDTSKKIAVWKREEKGIGKDKYPVYEVVKFVVPGLDKKEAVNFVKFLLKTLERKNLFFKDWQIQRDVRRKVKMEIRIHVLSRFKRYKAKVNDLTEKIFEALEELEWKK